MKAAESITLLLREARRFALDAFEGRQADKRTLLELAYYVRTCVLAQASAGLWAEHGIDMPSKIAGLRVTAELGNVLLGEPAIKLDFDFAKTALPMLQVKSE